MRPLGPLGAKSIAEDTRSKAFVQQFPETRIVEWACHQRSRPASAKGKKAIELVTIA